MIVYKFRTTDINLIQKEYVKLDETCQDTQVNLNANLSNVMDIWPQNYMKLHTAFKHYNNSYKDLIRS